MKNSRQFRHQQWFNLAVDAYIAVNTTPSQGGSFDRAAQITETVNAGLPLFDRIKRNTVTRNLEEIARAATEKIAK
jgi:hypothetical protein